MDRTSEALFELKPVAFRVSYFHSVSCISLRLAELIGQLLDFRHLSLCDRRPRPTVDRRLGLVREECRRHLYFGIPQFGVFSLGVVIKDEGLFVSNDGTTCLIFAISKA